MAEIINLYDEFEERRDSLTYRILYKAASEIDPGFAEIDFTKMRVELKINGTPVPIILSNSLGERIER